MPRRSLGQRSRIGPPGLGKKNLLRVHLIIGLRVYVTVCFSAVVGACVRYGVRPKRGGASDCLSGWSRPIPVVCSVSANFRQTQSCV
jgi:hypothetical protein